MRTGEPARLAVLVSGNGSNLQAIIDATRAGALEAAVAVVVSNRRAAHALVRAARAGIPTEYCPFNGIDATGQGMSREAYDAGLATLVERYEPDLVVLAGWMHILSRAFLDRFAGRVLNLHPALPGCFPGVDAIKRAYEAHRRGEIDRTGVMVHRVVPEVDAGPVVCQVEIPIHPADALEDLEVRVHEAEHWLLIRAIRDVLEAAKGPLARS